MKGSKQGFLLAHLALLTVALCYGVNYITLKPVFNAGFNNFEILGLRAAFGITVFLVYHLIAIKEKIQKRSDYLRLAICALFGVTLNQLFFLWGLSKTSPVHSSVLMISSPIWVFLIAFILKQEKINLQKVIGLVVSFLAAAGLVLYDTGGTTKGNEPSVIGDLFITINAASYALYLVLVRPLIQRYNAFTITKWIFIFGGIPNLLVGLYFLEPDHFTQQMTNEIWVGLGVLILGATLGAYFLNAWALKIVPSSSVGVYIYLQPVLVTILTTILGLGEVNLLKISYILLIFAGVFLVTTRTNFLVTKRKAV